MTSWRILLFPRAVAVTVLVVGVIVGTAATPVAAQRAPTGQAVMAWPVTIAPSWFDPSTAPPQIAPFGMLYAIHHALVRPYPGQKMGSSLAESWRESPDGKVYEFAPVAGPAARAGPPSRARASAIRA